jgi:hypothetical protein
LPELCDLRCGVPELCDLRCCGVVSSVLFPTSRFYEFRMLLLIEFRDETFRGAGCCCEIMR